ncbi:hypothetical protein ACOMHN_050685 [Nucella lapillus]
MEGTCYSQGVLVLVLYFVLLQGTSALRFTQNLQNGSTLYRCVGDDVTFRWSYVTDPSENVVATFLYSAQNGTLVTRFDNRVMTSSRRVTNLRDGSTTLSGLTSDDAGTYGIHVRLYRSSLLHTQTVNLVVLEPPKLMDGNLEAVHLDAEDMDDDNNNNNNRSSNNNNNNNNRGSNNNKTCGFGGRLRCGHFITLGVPPVTVVWTDPDQQEYTSSLQENGYFLLDLPASLKGGNYTCSLVMKPEVAKCLHNDRPFKTSASIFLETTETKVEEQAEDLQELKEQMEEVRTHTSKLERSQSSAFMQAVLNRIQHLEDDDGRVREELNTQKAKAEELEASTSRITEDLNLTLHRRVLESEVRNNQSVQDKFADLSGRLGGVEDGLYSQNVASSEHQNSLSALQQKLETLQNQFNDHLHLSSQLQSDLTAAHSSLDQQKSMITELQNKVQQQEDDNEQRDKTEQQHANLLDVAHSSLNQQESLITELQNKVQQQEDDNEQQKQVNSEQNRVSSEQLQLITSLQTNISTIVSRLAQEEVLSSDLQSRLTTQREDLIAQIDKTEQQQRNINDHRHLSNQLQSDLTTAHSSLDQQKSLITELQNKVQQQEDDNEQRDKTEQQHANLLDVAHSSLDQQKSLITELQNKVQQQEDDNEQRDKTVQQHANLLDVAHSSLNQQESLIIELQNKVQQQEDDNEQQKQVNAEQNRVKAEQLQLITSLQTNISTIVSRLAQEEAVSSDLQSRLTKQREDLKAQRDKTEQQQRNIMASVQNSTEIQKNVSDDLENRLMEMSEEWDRNVSGVEKKLEDLSKHVGGFYSRTFSRFEKVELIVNNTRKNLTTAVENLEREQLRLSGSLNDSAQVEKKLSDLEERVNDQAGQRQSDIQSLALDVAGLQRNVSVLLPRLTSVATRVETANQDLQPIRLVGGANVREGRVEIRVGRRWGTVCDDGWDNNDAKVVCNMLGYFAPGAVAKSSAAFGQGSGPIVLDDVNCDGSELGIQNCGHLAFGTHNCGHNEDASVVCAGY